MNTKKTYFGIWNGNNQVEWFKSEKQGFDYLENNRLNKYKNLFEHKLEEINNFCYNSDELENILNQKNSEDEYGVGGESEGEGEEGEEGEAESN